METAIMQSIPDILQRMNEVCPVRNTSYIRMESNNPSSLLLEWRYKIGGSSLLKSVEIDLIAIKLASVDIIQLEIDSLKDASWELF